MIYKLLTLCIIIFLAANQLFYNSSGLDSSISKQLVYLLHLLARQGRTVVITMHQPSAALLRMVDRLYAIAAGQCAYMGTVANLLPFLDHIDLPCPKFNNPVDYRKLKMTKKALYLDAVAICQTYSSTSFQTKIVKHRFFRLKNRGCDWTNGLASRGS